MPSAAQMDRDFSRICYRLAQLAEDLRALDPALPLELAVELAGYIVWFQLKGRAPGPREVH